LLTISVVIPVRDGERYLDEVLRALAGQKEPHEVLVIDSGSTDASVRIATAHGARVLRIAPEEFGHGRTRNLGALETTGDVICFLTQDATPTPGWLTAMLDGFAIDSRVGAVFGPHLPRADTSPMIARELTEFFARRAPDGVPVVETTDGYLSNVNAAYRRTCWEQIRFHDVPYAEDQAFGIDLLRAGWMKVFHPAAAVYHAHDYGYWAFLRRYFDEYRGLRQTVGWVEPFRLKGAVGGALRLTRRDRAWMLERGWSGPARTLWTARAFAHHLGRKIFAAAGSRHHALPRFAQRLLSLERRED
jgi:glycosyltransferase involved in cell wall biosynthesis